MLTNERATELGRTQLVKMFAGALFSGKAAAELMQRAETIVVMRVENAIFLRKSYGGCCEARTKADDSGN